MRVFVLIIVFCFSFLVIPGLAQTTDLQTDFTYQGFLSNSGGPVTAFCNFEFSLFDAATAGNPIGATQTVNAVIVSNGAFNVQLDFGSGVFNGEDRYLQIAVQCPGDLGFITLAPRQPIFPSPYSGYALSVPWAGISGIPAGFADGIDDAASGWALSGNAGTTPGTDFIGTTDNVALEFHVNGTRAYRIESVDNGTYNGNNVIGGYSGNTVISGVVGATIFGGGRPSAGTSTFPNTVSGSFGTISGGSSNNANLFATVGGGYNSDATGSYTTVGGGCCHDASGNRSTVGGGTSTLRAATLQR